ncbi:MAG: hypothetical protein ABF250_00510 [Polaribacter sp.]|uniref:hypothetical protein n=1 Tax=Polaribacter sp. TaxID=1920175 RepID=UPI002629A11C|nr:hypothetical protein [uncultured Polaribacter sp.]
MNTKIDKALEYYNFKSKEILNYINKNNNLTIDDILEKSNELSILEYKITALEVAKEN